VNDEEEHPPTILPYGREQPKAPPSPALRLLQLAGYAVVGFVVYVAALIGATSSAAPLPARIGCTAVVLAPVLGLLILLTLGGINWARETYLDIKAAPDPRARRRKIAGVIVSSVVMAGVGAGWFWLRLEVDRAADERGAAAATPAPATARPAPAPTSSSTAAAARTLHRLINDSPVIVPPPAATTQPARPDAR
jgi:hypothetical protein